MADAKDNDERERRVSNADRMPVSVRPASAAPVGQGVTTQRQDRAAKTRLRDRKWFQRLVVWGAILVAWEVLGAIAGPALIPRVSEILTSMIASFGNGDIVTLLSSLRQMLIGFALAAVIGIPLGFLLGSSRLADLVLGIYINALFVTSLEALLPFIIILFGTKFAYRVVIVFLFAVVYIIVNTASGTRAVSSDLREMAAAFRTPRRKIYTDIVLPSILPYVISGLRLGMGSAVKGMIVAELWVTVDTGQRLIDLSEARALPEFFALAVWIVLFGWLCTTLLLAIQKRLTPWASQVTNLRGQDE